MRSCPFCESERVRVTAFNVVRCEECMGEAPLDIWEGRPPTLPVDLYDTLRGIIVRHNPQAERALHKLKKEMDLYT